VACLEAFETHWGRKTLNAMKALHALRFSEHAEDEMAEEVTQTKLNRNSFLNFLSDDEGEDANNAIL
jgi:hypothetical protein